MTGWSLFPYLRLSTTIEFFLLRNASCFLGHVPFILLCGGVRGHVLGFWVKQSFYFLRENITKPKALGYRFFHNESHVPM